MQHPRPLRPGGIPSVAEPERFTLPEHQADVLGWMVDAAAQAPRELHQWQHVDGHLIGAGAERTVLDTDLHALAGTGLIEVIRRNYVDGNTFVLGPRAVSYIAGWRAQHEGLPEVEPTGWQAVDQAVETLRKRMASATTTNDFKAVGHECATVLEALGRTVFRPSRHLPEGDPEPSNNDAKRKLEFFTQAVAGGRRFAHVRKIIVEAYAQGHKTKHRDAPDRLDAEVGAAAVVMLVSIIRRFADAEQTA